MYLFQQCSIMRFLITGSFLFAAFAVLATAEEWSWGKDKSAASATDPAKPAAADTATDRESKSIDSYSELNDDNGGSQEDGGASVAGLSGNETDTQPRHLIKDRLCGLGLMEVNNDTHKYGRVDGGFFVFRVTKKQAHASVTVV